MPVTARIATRVPARLRRLTPVYRTNVAMAPGAARWLACLWYRADPMKRLGRASRAEHGARS